MNKTGWNLRTESEIESPGYFLDNHVVKVGLAKVSTLSSNCIRLHHSTSG